MVIHRDRRQVFVVSENPVNQRVSFADTVNIGFSAAFLDCFDG
jgi:hypothetical protein